METKMKNTQLYLPHELIIQILLRLPVKSLLRFKCVCKLWFSLISDTHFANSHFQITAATHSPTILFLSYSDTYETQEESERLTHSDFDTHFQLVTATRTHTIWFASHPYLLTPSIGFQESLNPNSASASASLNLNFTPFKSYYNIQIIGSCRGFILLHCYCQQMLNNNIYIFNPSTRVHKKLPLSLFGSNVMRYRFGFGYDQSTDDYLMVSMSCDPSLANVSSHLEFFSLRDNTWKEIEGTHFPYMNSSILSYGNQDAGLLYNGAIHWLALRRDLKKHVIVTFDLMERKLGEIHFPDDFDYDYYIEGLWVFGEFLSVWAPGLEDDGILEIWVMKEYKMHSSWTKIVLPTDGLPNEYFIPLCSTKSGYIIGRDGDTGWVKYNDKGHLLDHSYCNYIRGSQPTMYIESLFSLPADNKQA
jgi:F-box interacting protein